MRLRVAVFGTGGLLATAFGIGLLVRPELFLDVEPIAEAIATVAALDQTRLVLAASIVAVLYVALAARSRPRTSVQGTDLSGDRRFARTVTSRPEAVTADQRGLAAAGIDLAVQRAVESGHRSQNFRSTLGETAVSVYANTENTDDETARAAIERGVWTDDRVAAAFLAGDGGPTPTVWDRIRLWLVPERERERRIERTIAAIERLQEEP